MRLAIDTGGTFTDLVVEDGGRMTVHKRPTVAADPPQGILDVIGAAAQARGETVAELLGASETLIHATTHSLNALLTGRTARTALLTSAGHRDVLTLREGGREHFNVRAPYPEAYVPRSLTFEVGGRIAADGRELVPLDEDGLLAVLDRVAAHEVEAVAVCLLWSMLEPAHERRVGELICERLPGVPYTLSHALSPTVREFRRASATAIDASLKPLMDRYLRGLSSRLREAGFGGRLLMVTSAGSLLDMEAVADAPIHSIKSGPAMAPVAGRHFARAASGDGAAAIVADTGGTSYDVAVVRDGEIPWTRETWLGTPYLTPMTGFPSVDVRSYGAGGGSIAWVDEGGLLRIGPQSAGADPGPVAYGRGGTQPTVTDASLVLGHLDPDDFLGGRMRLDRDAAAEALERELAPLGLGATEAAAAVLELVTEEMVRAIEDAVIRQGIDPASSVLVGGGGAAGLNAVGIARRLGCPTVLLPGVSAALSAAGALLSNLARDFRVTAPMRSDRFDHARASALMADLHERSLAFLAEAAPDAAASGVRMFAEAHYAREVWDIEVAVPGSLSDEAGLRRFVEAFHRRHEELYAVADEGATIEIVSWRAHAWAQVRADQEPVAAPSQSSSATPPASARAWFAGHGWMPTARHRLEDLPAGAVVEGPAVIASPVTTSVVDPGAVATALADGTLQVAVPRR